MACGIRRSREKTVDMNDMVTLTATANEGYELLAWRKDGVMKTLRSQVNLL
mgnify:CR=1 FL=1